MHICMLPNACKYFPMLPSKTSTHSVGQKNVCSKSFYSSLFGDWQNLQIFPVFTLGGFCILLLTVFCFCFFFF